MIGNYVVGNWNALQSSLNDAVLNGPFLFDTKRRGEISWASGGTPQIRNRQPFSEVLLRIQHTRSPSDIALFVVEHTPSLQEWFGGIQFLSQWTHFQSTHFQSSHGWTTRSSSSRCTNEDSPRGGGGEDGSCSRVLEVAGALGVSKIHHDRLWFDKVWLRT